MPMVAPRMSPRSFMLRFSVKERVGNAEIEPRAKFE